MVGRLSENQLTSVLDAGYRSLPWDAPQASGFLAGINFDVILDSPDAKEIIQSLPPQALYFGLKKNGLEDSLDVLPHLSEDQVTRIVDYDVWYKDRLVPKKAYSLLKLFGAISSKELYRRFAYLDEEYQLSLLSGLLVTFDLEEFEAMTQERQDTLYAMPCKEVYYQITSDDKDTIDFIETLMESLKEHNLRYAYSLLGHAAFSLLSENEEAVRQFRVARMEEDGFVSYEDSLSCFTPLNFEALRQQWSGDADKPAGQFLQENQTEDFLTRVMGTLSSRGWSVDEQFEIHQRLLFLTNSLCSASQVEPEDLHALNHILEQCRSLVSLGLEYLSQGNVEVGVEVLQAEHPKVLFRVAISLVQELRSHLLNKLRDYKLPSAEKLLHHAQGGQWGQVLALIDRDLLDLLGFEACEILKGLFNRFPMAPDFGLDDQSLRFLPLSSLARLSQLRDYAAGLSGLLYLAQIAGVSSSENLDKGINTALVNSLLRGEFVANVLTSSEIAAFEALDRETLDQKKDTLLQFLMTALLESSPVWDLSQQKALSQGMEQITKILNSQMRELLMARDSHHLSPKNVMIEGV